jgi:hypothetical protein
VASFGFRRLRLAAPFWRHGEQSVAGLRRAISQTLRRKERQIRAKCRSLQFYEKLRLIRLEFKENPRSPANRGFKALR